MTHEEAFLQDILEHPDDDAPRLVYADWLMDRGDPAGAARGEFIHLQCALARLADGAPRPADVVARERQLLEAHRREWGSVLQRLGCRCWEYRRGFVEGVGLPASDFLAQAGALFRMAPVRQLKLYDSASLMTDLAACPHLARIEILDLEANALGDLEVQLLAASPHLGSVHTLLFWSNHVGDAGAASLVKGASLGELTRLDLSGNLVSDAGAKALAAAPLLRQMKLLDLQGNQIGDPGALALARSLHTDGLGWLDLGKNPIGADAQAALRERFAGRVHVWG